MTPQNNIDYEWSFQLPLKDWRQIPIAENITYVRHETLNHTGWIYLERGLASIVPENTTQASKEVKHFTDLPSFIPKNYNDGQHGKTSAKTPSWHLYLGSNRQLSKWTSVPFSRMEIMPGSRNLASFLGLVRPWVLDENRLLPLCQSSVIPDDIFKIIFKPTDKYSHHPSSKKLLFIPNGDHTENHSWIHVRNQQVVRSQLCFSFLMPHTSSCVRSIHGIHLFPTLSLIYRCLVYDECGNR